MWTILMASFYFISYNCTTISNPGLPSNAFIADIGPASQGCHPIVVDIGLDFATCRVRKEDFVQVFLSSSRIRNRRHPPPRMYALDRSTTEVPLSSILYST